jgi:hypothetical protein
VQASIAYQAVMDKHAHKAALMLEMLRHQFALQVLAGIQQIATVAHMVGLSIPNWHCTCS